jgi:AraC-like DNA-binding protein
MLQKRRTAADEPFMLIRTLLSEEPAGGAVHDHAHDWHQLIHVSTGLMVVTTGQGSWIAPPVSAVWVPAHIRHSIRFAEPSALCSVYVRPGDAALANNCQAVAVSPLLRELIVRATQTGMLDERDPVETALARLIIAELDRSETPPFTLPQPVSPALRRATALIAEQHPDARSIAMLAPAIGMSERTLERGFVAETGMTPGRWRQQHLLLMALEKIAGGLSVKAAASIAGYATPSAFVAAFRKAFGVTPGRYFTTSPAG